jgi:hypothetical protein
VPAFAVIDDEASIHSHGMQSRFVLLAFVLAASAITACGNGDERPRDVAAAASPMPASASSAPAPSVCADLLTFRDVFTACGLAGTLRADTLVFDDVPACSFSLEPTSGPAVVNVLHAVVRRYASADLARTTYPLDERGAKITVISGLGEAAIHYDSSDPKLWGETVAFRRGPLAGFVETNEGLCSRSGLEKVAATLLARIHDDAGAPRVPPS